MNNSLTSYLSTKDKSKILVIEAGERLSRSSDYYKQLVFLGKSLSKKGFTFISATNSGVSEAIFLGYKLTNTYKTAMMAVLDQLKQAPHTTDRLWLDVAIKATASIPNSENKSILLTTTSNKKVSPYAHKVALFHSKEVLEKQYTLFGHHPILYCNHNQSKTIYQSFKSLKKSKKPSYGLFPEKAENRLIFKDSSRLNWHQFFQEFSLEIDDCQLIIKSIETTKNLIHKLNKLLCSSTL
jgi:hypothetical protein